MNRINVEKNRTSETSLKKYLLPSKISAAIGTSIMLAGAVGSCVFLLRYDGSNEKIQAGMIFAFFEFLVLAAVCVYGMYGSERRKFGRCIDLAKRGGNGMKIIEDDFSVSNGYFKNTLRVGRNFVFFKKKGCFFLLRRS